MRRITAVLLVMILWGCGGDDSDSSTTATAPPTTRDPVQVDKERATRIVLTATDLPGYTEDTAPEEEDDEVDKAFAACLQNDPVLTADEPANPRTVDGKDFEKGEELTVSSKATIAATEDQARTALTQVRSRTVLDCFTRTIRTELPKTLDPGVNLGNVTVTSPAVAPVGDEAVGLRIVLVLSAEGETARVTLDVTIIRRERAVAFLSTNAVNTAFPEAERASLATKLADRMGP